jgi:hypothetical protein
METTSNPRGLCAQAAIATRKANQRHMLLLTTSLRRVFKENGLVENRMGALAERGNYRAAHDLRATGSSKCTFVP